MKQLISRILFITLALMAILIGVYPFSYFIDIQDRAYGLFGLKQKELLENTLWNIAFYSHIVLGGVALLIGWIGFIKKSRASKFIKIHRGIGKTYVIAVFISSLAAIYIGFLAEGGIIAKLGFITLGIVWFYTTLVAYKAIRNKKIEIHQK